MCAIVYKNNPKLYFYSDHSNYATKIYKNFDFLVGLCLFQKKFKNVIIFLYPNPNHIRKFQHRIMFAPATHGPNQKNSNLDLLKIHSSKLMLIQCVMGFGPTACCDLVQGLSLTESPTDYNVTPTQVPPYECCMLVFNLRGCKREAAQNRLRYTFNTKLFIRTADHLCQFFLQLAWLGCKKR